MVQKELWTMIEGMSVDRRISDKWFRWVFQEIKRPNLLNKIMRQRIEILRHIAVIETERERMDNPSAPKSPSWVKADFEG